MKKRIHRLARASESRAAGTVRRSESRCASVTFAARIPFSFWYSSTLRPEIAGPAISTTARMRGSFTAAMGAMSPPSLCPASATRRPSMSLRKRR